MGPAGRACLLRAGQVLPAVVLLRLGLPVGRREILTCYEVAVRQNRRYE
jgi:hypothetical protein